MQEIDWEAREKEQEEKEQEAKKLASRKYQREYMSRRRSGTTAYTRGPYNKSTKNDKITN